MRLCDMCPRRRRLWLEREAVVARSRTRAELEWQQTVSGAAMRSSTVARDNRATVAADEQPGSRTSARIRRERRERAAARWAARGDATPPSAPAAAPDAARANDARVAAPSAAHDAAWTSDPAAARAAAPAKDSSSPAPAAAPEAAPVAEAREQEGEAAPPAAAPSSGSQPQLRVQAAVPAAPVPPLEPPGCRFGS